MLPLRGTAPVDDELVSYLTHVACWCEDVIVVDGSEPSVFAANAERLAWVGRHVAPDPARRCLMGKVAGVLTGVWLARHERVVLADDDVRYSQSDLSRTAELLDGFDLVRPQNYFSPLVWHAVWDTARTLLNRSMAADYPGTFAVRRSVVVGIGGYDGDVIFENLELIRTVEAHGGLVVSPLDLYVRRLPPAAGHFWGQRTRQAYDDLAIPARMGLWLGVVPSVAGLSVRRRWGALAGAGLACVLTAERGRRRAGGRAVFPLASSLLAPGWVLERGVCAWLAVAQRVRFGGVRYGDSVIRVAAHSRRELRLRARALRD